LRYKLIFISVLVFLCSGCQTVQTILKPVLTQEGEVYVYMQPLPQEADGLRFSLEEISAVRSDGTEVPLSLSMKDFKGGGKQRQRFVASGSLLPGAYTGLNIKGGKAFRKGEVGENELEVQEKPEFNGFSFEVRRKRALVINLSFKVRESVGKGSGFKPDFSLSIPPRPLNSLIGYATNYSSNSITVFDKRTGEIMGMIATGKGPKSVVFDRSRMLAYVVISGEDGIDVIDLLSNDVINRVRMNTGDNPSEAALTPDGRTLLVVNEGSNTMSFIDPLSNFETSRINVGSRPRSLIIDPNGSRAFIFNYLSNSISVVNIGARSITTTLKTETSPVRGDFSKNGDKLFIYHDWSPNILVFDTRSLSLLKMIYVGTGIGFIKVDTATDRLYVARKHQATVDIFDQFSAIPMDFLKSAGGASYMFIDEDESNMLMVLPDQSAIQSINLISKKERYLMDTGNPPYWASIIGER
jgi:YVTN family beta-propeller protein